MPTRSTVHFVNEDNEDRHIVYVHFDGEPEKRWPQIQGVLQRIVDHTQTYNRAGFVATQFLVDMVETYAPKSRTNPMVVRLVNQDPNNIEYRYVINCGLTEDDGFPEMKVQKVQPGLLRDDDENYYYTGEEFKAER